MWVESHKENWKLYLPPSNLIVIGRISQRELKVNDIFIDWYFFLFGISQRELKDDKNTETFVPGTAPNLTKRIESYPQYSQLWQLQRAPWISQRELKGIKLFSFVLQFGQESHKENWKFISPLQDSASGIHGISQRELKEYTCWYQCSLTH